MARSWKWTIILAWDRIMLSPIVLRTMHRIKKFIYRKECYGFKRDCMCDTCHQQRYERVVNQSHVLAEKLYKKIEEING